jgi:Ca2+-binding RTX toxin-like protein
VDAAGTTATCTSASIAGIDSLNVNSGAGDDSVTVAGSAPRTLAAYINGGDGNDDLNGGPEDDFIQGGLTGSDQISGGTGDDSLQSDTDGDSLNGNGGDDLMVVDFPCEGANVVGGGGKDKVGFDPSRTPAFGQIGGAISSPGVGNCHAGHISNDIDSLEGSNLGDTLIGNGHENTLVGRGGNDTLIGKGGTDELDGGPGGDKCKAGNAKHDVEHAC